MPRILALLLIAAVLVPAARAQTHAGDGLPWWNDTVFYQVFLRSFQDSEDGALACDGVGDIPGLIDRLDYLNDGDPDTDTDLGITGLWLMPLMESPSYHGYDIVDYYTVDREYGTLDDFRRLVDAAQARGIRVILDLVFNHTSDAHPWFAHGFAYDPRLRDWYIFREQPGDWTGPWGQNVWHQREGVYYYGIFGPHMPDLNFTNPEVTAAVREISRFWLDEMGVDGFRLDAIRHVIEDGPAQENTPQTHQWLKDYYTFYKEIDPDVMTVGEVWDATENVAPYVRDQELDLAFEFDLAGAILEAVQTGRAAPVLAQMAETEAAFPPLQYATFLRNHDQSRLMTELRGDFSKAAPAATVLLTLPGVPFLYYGEEIGMVGPKPDPLIRTPMQWTSGLHADFTECTPWMAVNEDYEGVNVLDQSAEPGSLLNLYRRLINLRNAHPLLRRGTFTAVESGHEGVLAYLREYEGEAAVVVVNLSDQPVRDYALALSQSGLAQAGAAMELLHGANATAPTLNAGGGFSGYRPVRELAPRTGYLVRL
ncbi:MAG: alpha-amylase family glycosyl hydrolase [Rhodothermales bacterium]|nr:alpha-amylase family glycosyl hydrolase [Rhodothermales bacterium]